ncbi:uncharacterized protein LOC118195559 [Stegodyphus dumicola]|uniref:uncharacterized protein LOC118195559 n=1 Tax=Stegodyphus dumicola TaxID=202533 RepID=UPI0015A908AD|nr:uncharacterized protein LOC118195559 [Stegodyphus dumicola]
MYIYCIYIYFSLESEPLQENLNDEFLCPDSPLIIEREDRRKANPLPSGRTICNMSFVIVQARTLEQHSLNCKFGGSFIFNKVIRRGLVTTYNYVCDKIFSIMEIPYMSNSTFASCERTTGKIIQGCAQETMCAAIEEEKRQAELRNDKDNDGYHCITVIVDGGWCKRSYGHGYNASSGISVIIGMVTQKILFVGIRNKVCLICSAIEDGKMPNKVHLCWRNWNGPSTGMESSAIVEGLNYLQCVHKIRCTRLVGDGDANTMAKVKESVSYGGRVIKVECANHAVRRYRRALEKLQQNTARFPGAKGIAARKLLKIKMPLLVRGARVAIKAHALPSHYQHTQEAIDALVSDLRNGPHHIFGKHDACSAFCAKKGAELDSTYNEIFSSGMLQAIEAEVGRVLISCSSTLIWNATNNPAESFMSQLCKTSGGKRVDFSKAGGMNRRASIAVMAYQNPAQQWQKNAQKAVTGSSPRTPTLKFLASRNKRHVKRLERRRLFDTEKKKRNMRKAGHIQQGGDISYGDFPEKPDLSDEAYELAAKNFFISIEVPKKDSLEAVTRGQSSSERWRHERSRRISSSFFKDVADRRPTTLSAALVKRIIYNDNVSTKALKYGLANEAVALNQYKEKHMGKNIRRCGLFIDPKYPFLCTSPDGLIDEDGLLEIKCPYTARFSADLSDFFSKPNSVGLRMDADNNLYLPKSHKYYFQIQGQLAITERNWCDLYIWCREDAITLRIPEDKTFWISLVPKLEKFYVNCILPELVDPRAPRKMSLREPKYIVDARAQNEKQKQATASVKQTQEKREIEISEADKIISSPRKNAGEKRIRKPKIIFDL